MGEAALHGVVHVVPELPRIGDAGGRIGPKPRVETDFDQRGILR